ncbi:PspA/IM30 family protein [Metabacillus iocasae]|uniref:Phage shock protein A n=1 Tax=Priestia iocasae TaxID=2291674 RepID=A0ABS2QYS1_9BACI|nr:PspA/IM30 family protein [Metabacillus iocasae]MBM7704137.1 phage shock protein A [Metabacillus iocasae]
MSNLFTRMKDSITSDLHQLLDQKEQKNPLSALNHYLRQCEQETEKVRKLVERQHLLKEEFTREYHHAKEMIEKRKYQAGVAEKADEKDLHHFAVQEQLQYEERARHLQEALTNASHQLDELERKYEEMKHKLKDMHIKRMELMGRENIARAHHRMNQVLDNSAYTMKSYSRFQEMETYIDRLEHQVNRDYHRSTIDSRIAHLEKDVKNKDGSSIS